MFIYNYMHALDSWYDTLEVFINEHHYKSIEIHNVN